MPELTPDEQILRDHGGYDWLLGGKLFWSVTEIVRELDNVGFTVSDDAVWRWIKKLPHTQDFGGPLGLRATKADLIELFASRSKTRTHSSKKVINE